MISTDTVAHKRFSVAMALLLVCSLLLAYPRPASADGAASTRNIILGGAALAAAIALTSSPAHGYVRVNAVVGRTGDGGLVYADGRVVYPSGDVLYVSNGGGRPCGWTYGLPRCYGRPVVYYPRSYHGHRHDRGDWRHDEHHHDHHDHHD